jgi:alcohol dehydrogenase class IV
MSFDFSTAGRIIFGRETVKQLCNLGNECGQKPIILTGSGKAGVERILLMIESIPQEYTHWIVNGEPTVDDIQKAVKLARNEKCDYVIGFGGGSVLDSGKAVAIMLKNRGHVLSYLEGVGKNKPIMNPSVPYIAIPTTSGTGSEVTRNAVLTVPESRIKVSMRSPLMIPKIALVDPILTCSLPPDITAYTGMDALTQVIEPIVSIKRNELTEIIGKEGIKRVAKSLKKAFENGDNHNAREDMSFASLMGGISLANAGLGMVHGFAGVIGGMFNAHHGAICASLLPAVVEINIKAMLSREPENDALNRYKEIACIFSGKDETELKTTWEFLGQLSHDLIIPHLHELGIKKSDFSSIIAAAKNASSTKGNPIHLTDEELILILEQSY